MQTISIICIEFYSNPAVIEQGMNAKQCQSRNEDIYICVCNECIIIGIMFIV